MDEIYVRLLISAVGLIAASWMYQRWMTWRLDRIPPPPDLTRPPEHAEELAEGLYSVQLKPPQRGHEALRSPTERDEVLVHYTGWRASSGQMFDSSVILGAAAQLPMSGVIRGWQVGLAGMKPGEKRRLWVPAELAYGDVAGPGLPSGALVFDVELVEVIPL